MARFVRAAVIAVPLDGATFSGGKVLGASGRVGSWFTNVLFLRCVRTGQGECCASIKGASWSSRWCSKGVSIPIGLLNAVRRDDC
jgi:hypothetical protein